MIILVMWMATEISNGFLKQVVYVDLALPSIPIKIIWSNHFGHLLSPKDGVPESCATNKRMLLVQVAPPF